ncbi:MAG: adenylate/guanylate cyclase domain-containing protein, partial [Myxococcales bacterium]|nr:adenylate/guanylate cyclase domain-containing protein [Myxococcales bacterium]
FNRDLGLPPMQFTEVEGGLSGEASYGGWVHRWDELPWQWVAGREAINERRYSRGMAHHVRGVYLLTPTDGGTALTVYFGWLPRGWVGRLLLRRAFPRIRDKYATALAAMAQRAGGAPLALPAPARQPPAVDAEALAHGAEALRAEGVEGDLVGRLVDLVREGDDLDLHRVQPLRLARAWRADETAVVVALLHATRIGLFELHWDVVCPHCRGTRVEARSLGEVPAQGSCTVCDIDFDTAGTEALEVTFRPHPAVREVPERHYCSAEPATKDHVQVQQRLAPGEQRRLATALGLGRYRLRVRGAPAVHPVDVAEGGAAELPWRASAPPAEAVTLAPAPALVLHNDTTAEQTFVVERAGWVDDALRPARLFTNATFRELFADEALAPGVQIAMGEQTILFTDMVGSTRFYAEQGDARAFNAVTAHFREVQALVEAEGGAVVKTIGDAVMAAFPTPIAGLACARAIQQTFAAEREDTPVRLRISLHCGPCIAVRLNAGIDYFGGTVNLAAKLQARAEAGEIAFSDALRRWPGVSDWLAEAGADAHAEVLPLRALDAPVDLWRWSLHGTR